MPARLDSVATAHDARRRLGKGALRLADDAARTCLSLAGRDSRDIDLLINVGVYRDGNLGEPALASLIQEDIGANPGLSPGRGRGTFSFDIADGGGGMITGAEVVANFLETGSIQRGMVVASDANPDRGAPRAFPFPRVGGALLLTHDAREGFHAFAHATYAEHEGLFESRVDWVPATSWIPGREGTNVLTVRERDGFAARCVDCADDAVMKFLHDLDLRPDQIDLLILSQFPREFPDQFADRLGVPTDRVAQVHERLCGAHTAGPVAALEAAVRGGAFEEAERSLFVTVGAGICVGMALYAR